VAHTGVIYRALDCKNIKKPMQIKKASAGGGKTDPACEGGIGGCP
jgi:hypothetical protein